MPVTLGVMGSAWYSIARMYKAPAAPEDLRWRLAAVAHRFMQAHQHRLEALVGGAFDFTTTVPSTKGIDFEAQPLARVLQLSARFRGTLGPLLKHRPEIARQPRTLNPHIFTLCGGGPSVRSARVLLVEDTWVSGATAMSAAQFLTSEGAHVVVLPLIRAYDLAWSGDKTPYLAAVTRPWDPTEWPRELSPPTPELDF